MTGILKKKKIAYFSMEIGLLSDIPTYAGGLGTLAGDTIKSSADLNLPLVAVTLISRRGYFRQELDYEEARKRELEDFYGKLEHIIVPMFYHRRDDWIKMMNNSIGMVASFFNSHRMMRRYVTEAYL